MMAWRYWIERNNQPWSCSKTKSCFPKKKRFQWFLREELHPYSSCSRRLLSAKRPPTPKEKQFFACQTLNERCCLHSTIDNKIGGGYVFIVLVAWIWDFLLACISSIFQSSIFWNFGHLSGMRDSSGARFSPLSNELASSFQRMTNINRLWTVGHLYYFPFYS